MSNSHEQSSAAFVGHQIIDDVPETETYRLQVSVLSTQSAMQSSRGECIVTGRLAGTRSNVDNAPASQCPHHAGIGLGRPPRRRCKERHLHPRPMTPTVFTTEMLAATDILYTQPRLGSMRQRHSTKG